MSSCGHCSWVQTGSISRPQVARSISSSEFLMAPLSQQPCLIWKLPGYWGLVFLGITRAQAVPACWSGSVLSVLIQITQHSLRRLDSVTPTVKYLQFYSSSSFWEGRRKCRPGSLQGMQMDTCPPPSWRGARLKCQRAANVLPEPRKEPSQRSALLAHAALHGQMALGSELTHAHPTQRQAKHAGS